MPQKHDSQTCFPVAEVQENVERFVATRRLGKKGDLVSFSPDTEPFRSIQSMFLTMLILERIMPFGNRVQIATKQVVPESVIARIAEIQRYPGQAVLFTSCATIAHAAELEPGAPPPFERFVNFTRATRHSLRNSLLVKPLFDAVTGEELASFVDVAERYQPDALCLGISYDPQRSFDVLEHPGHPGLFSATSLEDLGTARSILVEAIGGRIPVFLTSSCVSAYFAEWYPAQSIWEDYPGLCIGCRDCAGQYATPGPAECGWS